MKRKPTEQEIQDAIRILSRVTEDGAILDADDFVPVYIIPAILGNGRIQYQVSDGLPGRRSTSFDFNNYADARREYNRIAVGGWQKEEV